MRNLRVQLLKDQLSSLFSTSLIAALKSRFIVLVVTLKKEIKTTGWKSHLVVQRNPSKQEQEALNSKERFVLILGQCAVACYEGCLLLLMESLECVLHTSRKSTNILNMFSKGQYHKTSCWIIVYICSVNYKISFRAISEN